MEKEKGKRKEYGFKNSQSKSGELSIHINKDLARSLRSYAKFINRNCAQIAQEAIREYLERKQSEMVDTMTKEELKLLVKEFLKI